MRTNLPKYIENDFKILYNAEFKTDKYGYSYTDNVKMCEKLFKIAKTYADKYLEDVLDYLGYFCDNTYELAESDYRNQILSDAEYHFIQAMENYDEVYDEKINKQVKFIEMGFIDCVYSSAKNFKASNYQEKYPSKIVYRY